MAAFLKPVGLIFALLAVIAMLIVIPSAQFGVLGDWRVVFLSISYFIFFLGTIWRVIRYGQLANRQEDRQVQATSGRVASLITVVGLLSVHWLTLYTFSLQDQTLNTSVNQYLTVIAIALVFAAIFVSQVAIKTLGKFFDRLIIKSDHQLVTDGIYSLIRHPIYTSYILLFLGFCIMLQSLWGLGLLLTVCIVWFGNRITIEEQMLEERFGEEYQSYCQQTKRLFPYVY
ncbi:methyltransferase family protein [Nostoc sp. 'Peltigera membranacea cyanobiont' 232]|uniref:methyltransferase family protein n=1 Tax=Nostoc sp. 'Peltigera membranacea cyanobiont' 232 TaxID=2014531 RepID=UPI000B95B859|nr:isoprenylcysteine carboxylmethyltransferase family protein [Nostoc sp. 'Peltigera membranacea cyanobiont' 232]OYE04270.1 protein-S-isoprenylcysteine methyltransferase [Nostoc sp. 'Peltigera membranacea cyanobiont' 232]